MRDRDAATKQYMSHKDVVADAFNFYLYGGEQRILPERLRKMDATELASLYGKTDGEASKRFVMNSSYGK